MGPVAKISGCRVNLIRNERQLPQARIALSGLGGPERVAPLLNLVCQLSKGLCDRDQALPYTIAGDRPSGLKALSGAAHVPLSSIAVQRNLPRKQPPKEIVMEQYFAPELFRTRLERPST